MDKSKLADYQGLDNVWAVKCADGIIVHDTIRGKEEWTIKMAEKFWGNGLPGSWEKIKGMGYRIVRLRIQEV